MPNTRIVSLNAGGYTNIRASIPAHYMVVEQDAASRTKALAFKSRDDDFDVEVIQETGKSIIAIGHGRGGILGKPPNYAGVGYPAETAPSATDSGGGDIVLMVRFSDDSGGDVSVREVESEL